MGREGQKHQCVRDTSIGLPLTCPQSGIWPTTQACALTGNRTSDLLVRRQALNPLSHTSRAEINILNLGIFSFHFTVHSKQYSSSLNILPQHHL